MHKQCGNCAGYARPASGTCGRLIQLFCTSKRVSDGAASSHSGADYLIPNCSLHLSSVEWGRTIRFLAPANFDRLI
jgi:hypothetical protein